VQPRVGLGCVIFDLPPTRLANGSAGARVAAVTAQTAAVVGWEAAACARLTVAAAAAAVAVAVAIAGAAVAAAASAKATQIVCAKANAPRVAAVPTSPLCSPAPPFQISASTKQVARRAWRRNLPTNSSTNKAKRSMVGYNTRVATAVKTAAPETTSKPRASWMFQKGNNAVETRVQSNVPAKGDGAFFKGAPSPRRLSFYRAKRIHKTTSPTTRTSLR
jgi:hypothetical protein